MRPTVSARDYAPYESSLCQDPFLTSLWARRSEPSSIDAAA